MAPVHQNSIGEVCYNIWLDAFDDGLQSDKPRKKGVRLAVSSFGEMRYQGKHKSDVIEDWEWFQDTWALPTDHEMAVSGWEQSHHGLWVGWFVPELFRPKQLAKKEGVNSPVDTRKGKCVNDCDSEPATRSDVQKAFKVVYRIGHRGHNRLYALYDPDDKGICRSIAVPGGASNVMFFAEWRQDNLSQSGLRRALWFQKIKDHCSEHFTGGGSDASMRLHHDVFRASDEDLDNPASSFQDSGGSNFSDLGNLVNSKLIDEKFKTADIKDEDEIMELVPYESGSSPKRNRHSHQSLLNTKQGEMSGVRDAARVKIETMDDSDNEIQIVDEVPVSHNKKSTKITIQPTTPSLGESLGFIVDFIAAGRMAKVARLQDTYSRRATLDIFREHLASTTMAAHDSLAHNIAENTDTDTRVMLAETLVTKINQSMPGIIPAPSRGK